MPNPATISSFLSGFDSFEFFFSLQFWFAFMVIALWYRLATPNSKASRVGMLLASLGMILALPRFTVVGLAVFMVLALAVFIIGSNLNVRAQQDSRATHVTAAAGVIIIVVIVLAISKYRGLQDLVFVGKVRQTFGATDYFFLLGVSYISFRFIHFIVEGFRRQLENVNLLVFLNYAFFFPAFISGPIHRHNQFAQQWQPVQGRSVTSDLSWGTYRIVHGVFKKVVIAALVYPYALQNMLQQHEGIAMAQLLLGAYAEAVYFYLDFSAYSDIAIGSARLLGIELPENFRNPFFKRNIQQLWANWHISLTSWLTDYIYWPLVRRLRRWKALQRNPIVLSNIGIMITFAVCGIWHGEGLGFLLWGLYHGFGISVFNYYRTYKRRATSDLLRAYFRSRVSTVVGVFVTFNYFALGMVVFSVGDSEGISRLVSSLAF